MILVSLPPLRLLVVNEEALSEEAYNYRTGASRRSSASTSSIWSYCSEATLVGWPPVAGERSFNVHDCDAIIMS